MLDFDTGTRSPLLFAHQQRQEQLRQLRPGLTNRLASVCNFEEQLGTKDSRRLNPVSYSPTSVTFPWRRARTASHHMPENVTTLVPCHLATNRTRGDYFIQFWCSILFNSRRVRVISGRKYCRTFRRDFARQKVDETRWQRSVNAL